MFAEFFVDCSGGPATPVGEVCRPIHRSSASGLKENIKFFYFLKILKLKFFKKIKIKKDFKVRV